MRSLTWLLSGLFASTAALGGDLPALPPPPAPPSGNSASAADLPLPAAAGDSAGLPALPPPPAHAARSVDDVLPPLPAAPTAVPPAAKAAALPTMPPPPAPVIASGDSAGASGVGFTDTAVANGTTGVINGGRVNVRAGNSTKYEIIYTADPETPVTVYEKKGEWVKIGFPEKEFCYIEQRAVEGEVPMDIPEQGVARAVRNEQTKVYVRPWPGSTVVGALKTGDNVLVTGVRGRYLRIRPPASAFAWVFEKFVRYDNAHVQSVELTPAEKAAKEKEEALRKTIDEVKGLQKGKLPGSKELNPLLIKLRERTEAERREREAQRAAVKSLVNNLDKQMEAIDAETAARIDHINRTRVDMTKVNEETMRSIEEGYRPGSPPGSLGNSATGWIEHVAFWRNRPAEYRLVKGQEIICYVRSSRYNLTNYNGRHVVVNGKVEKSPTGNLNVLVVDTLRLFDQQRIEEPAAVVPATTFSAAPGLNDDRSAVRVVREKETAPIYRERTVYREARLPESNVVTLRDPAPANLEQNENIVIIEDNSGNDIRSNSGRRTPQIGERIDVTGMPTP